MSDHAATWSKSKRLTLAALEVHRQDSGNSRDVAQKYIRYGYQPPRSFVPRDISMKFQPWAMRDVDTWVRHNARHMLFVYGQNDPWGAERSRVGKGAKDSYVFTLRA